MNASAERHLSKAEGYLAKGEEFYRKAAAEIVAAQECDPTLGYAEIGERFGRGKTWAGDLVRWHTSGRPDGSPFSRETAEEKGRGAVEAKRVLREAPLEQVEQIISGLPKERKQAVLAQMGDAYAKARQEYDEKERNLTPVERKEREAAVASVHSVAGKMMSGFNVFGIVNYLQSATDVLKEMIAESTLTADGMKQIDAALAAFLDEYRVAQASAGVEDDREGVV